MMYRILTYLLSVFIALAPVASSAQLAGGLMFPGPGLGVSGAASALDCTGGTITTSGVTRIHTFTASSSLVCTGSGTANYLVVSGGGGGGAGGGGGGGAGGLLTGSSSLSATTYTVTVGAGGAASTGSGSGGDGGVSSFNSISPAGGGGGGGNSANGRAGGSGGGGGATGTNTTGGTGSAGSNGGSATGSGSPNFPTGGGGGSGGTGGSVTNGANGGAGGLGTAASAALGGGTYASGGGGATYTGTGGTVSAGGGGAGCSAASCTGTAGTANTGGGGGGSENATGVTGGSGVVIVSYPSIRNPLSLGTASAAGASTTVAMTGGVNIVAGDTVVVSVGHLTAAGTTVISVSDGTNTYSRATSGNDGATQQAELWYKINAAAVTGPTITATFSGSVASRAIGAARIAGGLTALDVAPAGVATTASAAPTVSTGTLASSNAEIVIGFLYVATAPTVTEGAGFTQVYNENASTVTNHLGYQVRTATTTVAYSPTNSVASNNIIMVAAFK